MHADATATGPPETWAEFPNTKISFDTLTLTKDRAVIAITEEDNELWLVEFAER